MTNPTWRVILTDPKNAKLTVAFLMEAANEEQALLGVEASIRSGVLPPMSDGPSFTVVSNYVGAAELFHLLSWHRRAQKMNTEPYVLIFPDVCDAEEWMRYQLSWYGRLWEDVKAFFSRTKKVSYIC